MNVTLDSHMSLHLSARPSETKNQNYIANSHPFFLYTFTNGFVWQGLAESSRALQEMAETGKVWQGVTKSGMV